MMIQGFGNIISSLEIELKENIVQRFFYPFYVVTLDCRNKCLGIIQRLCFLSQINLTSFALESFCLITR